MPRVIVIEDNPGDFRLIQLAVRKMGSESFELFHADSLKDAMAQLGHEPTDAILLDLGLPDVMGFDGIRKLRSFAPDTAIVVLTGHTDDQMAKNALREGAEDYLVKGEFNPEGLRRTLMYAMERRRSSRLREHLAQADRLAYVGKLAAGIAHEINNPAAVLMGNTAMMLEYTQEIESLCSTIRDNIASNSPSAALSAIMRFEELAPALREMSQDNQTSIRRVADTVRRLGSFSAMQSEKLEWVRMDEVVAEACRLANADFRHRLTMHQDLQAVPAIVGDRSRLTQVVVNLLINASHAMESLEPAERRLNVTVRAEGTQNIIVMICDTGIGIAPEHQQRILEPFFTTKPRGRGTGLGLPLSLESVRLHGGDIEITSELGQGTEVRVTLPQTSSLDLKNTSKKPSELKKAQVLIIDDEPSVLQTYRRMLQPPHDVVTALGGQAGLQTIEKSPKFDAILCDLMMPEMNGKQLFESLHAHYPSVARRVVFFTGGAVTEEMQSFAASLGPKCLQKPLERADILAAIAQTLESQRASG